MQLFIFVTTSAIVIVLFYLKILRPWQLRWGATDDEVNCAMSGRVSASQTLLTTR